MKNAAKGVQVRQIKYDSYDIHINCGLKVKAKIWWTIC
jgi:hypothetical protein